MPNLGTCRHLCVDMQRMFAEDTPWHVDWMSGVLPQVEEVAGRFREKTIFTRFIPPVRAPKTCRALGRSVIANGGC